MKVVSEANFRRAKDIIVREGSRWEGNDIRCSKKKKKKKKKKKYLPHIRWRKIYNAASRSIAPDKVLFYAPNFEEVGGAYCFWGVRPSVRPSVRHAF